MNGLVIEIYYILKKIYRSNCKLLQFSLIKKYYFISLDKFEIVYNIIGLKNVPLPFEKNNATP